LASLAVRVSVVIAVMAFAMLLRSGYVDAAASLYLQQRCEPNGTVSLGFTWEGNDPQALQQWIDVSSTGTWQPGTFSAAGPIAANVSTYVWPGWQPGTTYYARVNQQLSDGAWDASIMYRVEVQTCGGSPAPTGPVALPPQGSLPPAPPPQPQQSQQQPTSPTQSSSGGPRIASFTSPIGRGKDATITIQTQPNASCNFSYTLPNATTAAADATGQKTADGTGQVIWTFRVPSTSPIGDGSISITCAGQTTTSKLIVIEGGR
jgi:hypothetical protein